MASPISPSLVGSLCWLSRQAAALLLRTLYAGVLVPTVFLLGIFSFDLALRLVYRFIAMFAALLHLLCILVIMELLLAAFVVYLLMELVTLLEPVTHLGLVLVLVAELSITFLALVVTRIGWTLAVIQLSFVVNLLVVAPLVTLPFVTFSVCCFSLNAKCMSFSCSSM